MSGQAEKDPNKPKDPAAAQPQGKEDAEEANLESNVRAQTLRHKILLM